jgi:DNA-binding GntR family transcriptional regulator
MRSDRTRRLAMPSEKKQGRKLQSQTDAAVDQLRARIIDLALQPGARLDESLLIQEFGLGRTPAREALNRLSAEGFVNIIPNRGGAYVRNLDFREVGEIVAAYELAERILGQLCQFDDQYLVPDLDKIQFRYTKEVKARNYLGITAVNEEFHLRMFRTINNNFVYSFATSIHRHARRLIVLIHKLESADRRLHDEQFELNVQQHYEIIAAIKEKNRAKFEDIIVSHAQYTHKRLANIIQAMPYDFKTAGLRRTDVFAFSRE